MSGYTDGILEEKGNRRTEQKQKRTGQEKKSGEEEVHPLDENENAVQQTQYMGTEKEKADTQECNLSRKKSDLSFPLKGIISDTHHHLRKERAHKTGNEAQSMLSAHFKILRVLWKPRSSARERSRHGSRPRLDPARESKDIIESKDTIMNAMRE